MDKSTVLVLSCLGLVGGEINYSRWYQPVGCYKDVSTGWPNRAQRALRSLYLNTRHSIDWTRWPDMTLTIYTCAKAAKGRKMIYFGIQFYGECWSDDVARKRYNLYGQSNDCINGVGKMWTNFVYKRTCGSEFGCCEDGEKPAWGPNFEGCSGCHSTADIAFVVDSSGSVGKENWPKVLQFVHNVVNEFDIGPQKTHVGFIKFNHKAKVMFNFNEYTDKDDLLRAILQIEYTTGGTKTSKALELADSDLFSDNGGARKNVLKIVVVITDGKSKGGSAKVGAAAQLLKDKGVTIAAVGIKGARRDELEAMASSSSFVIMIDDFAGLAAKITDIVKMACQL